MYPGTTNCGIGCFPDPGSLLLDPLDEATGWTTSGVFADVLPDTHIAVDGLAALRLLMVPFPGVTS